MRSDDVRDHFVVGLQTAAEYSVAGIGHHAHATAFIGRLGCIYRGEWICCRFHTFDSGDNCRRTCLRLRTADGGDNTAGRGDIGHRQLVLKYKYQYVCVYIYKYIYIHEYMYICATI